MSRAVRIVLVACLLLSGCLILLVEALEALAGAHPPARDPHISMLPLSTVVADCRELDCKVSRLVNGETCYAFDECLHCFPAEDDD